ncbi:MAG: FecR domain-containing protein [Alphaproteobacteria bacterium]|nr:FecR domain-containing protein [Alphaproteobacteria bacterium]MBU1516424.1 FecR domain-containing protein [Alphaproteobacteria bacterium]MBU2093339.1 FecR domain-containing protein [Alphaproteobacteria bacterium]MBU2153826.1 FecR domain-containing protein [Alphaproteobacteria bacterium]MBU2307698.1 FecR domain-containing protein [Alphaproteobacteria bacterium]
MSGERDQQRPMEAADAAVHWFARLQDEAVTGDDWLAFEQWLAADPAHAAAYERLEGLWVDLDDLGEGVAAAMDAPVSLAAHRAVRAGQGLSRRGWLAAGAGLAASIAVGVGVANWPMTPVDTYATAPGQTRQLTLADGSKVWMNAGSRLDVRFERRARRVEMAEGEAAFDVTHDPQRPFLIATGDREVRVVGTEFNLRQRADDFALTVRRGVVEVRPDGAADAKPTRVAAGQQLTHKRGTTVGTLSATTPDAAFAWTRGQLVYTDATLSEVAADLSRSLGTPVRVADAATGRMRFTGVLTLDDKDVVLRRLEAFAPVRAERGPTGVTLRRR